MILVQAGAVCFLILLVLALCDLYVAARRRFKGYRTRSAWERNAYRR